MTWPGSIRKIATTSYPLETGPARDCCYFQDARADPAGTNVADRLRRIAARLDADVAVIVESVFPMRSLTVSYCHTSQQTSTIWFMDRVDRVCIRSTSPEDLAAIVEMSRRVYSGLDVWSQDQLESHLQQFPQGQFVATDESGAIRGMLATLILSWNDYPISNTTFRDFTDSGMFTNHDPVHGHTLYGAELMVDPAIEGYTIGFKLCRARRELAERCGLLRIRAAVPLLGYHDFIEELSGPDYLQRVMRGKLKDPALSFQLRWGVKVLTILKRHIQRDARSLGWTALIGWRNPAWSPYHVRMVRATRGQDLRSKFRFASEL
jgi:ribosomal protein S18 acetylase RimI-like enzyme